MMAIRQLSELLAQLGINVLVYQHSPLLTCQQADQLGLERQGRRTKNLFLRNNDGKRHILLITTPEQQVDLKMLSKQQQISRLGFASEQRLARYLGVLPGHVSLLALVNDHDNHVELWIDEVLWSQSSQQAECAALQCHPLDNTQTWVIALPDLERLLQHWQKIPLVLSVPAQMS